MRSGEVMGGRFEVARRVGAGAMGVVFRGVDRDTGADVAVKVLTGYGPEHAARFAREADTLAALAHPRIVRYVAHGVTADGEPYLVMDWLEGEDLAQRLARGELTPEEAVSVVHHAAEGLAVAHGKGIVHRDLKPSNLFLVGKSVAGLCLLDFGIAFAARSLGPLTRTGSVLGTPGYMAPEQARGRRGVDARADVFTLGCVLYRCLTGRIPFAGDDALAVLMMTVLEEAPRVQSARREISDDLDTLVAEMLARSPAARPRDAEAVLVRLEALGNVRRAAAAPGATRATRRTAAATRASPRHTNLRPVASSFHGRDEDLRRLDTLLDKERLVTIVGAAGTGKTRLSMRYGELYCARSVGEGGVWFCDLTEARDLDGVLGPVARAVGATRVSGGSDALAQIGLAIAARERTLVILDNCEQVVADVARAVTHWIADAPIAKFLATSRELLRVPGERAFELGPLSLPEPGGDVGASEAVRLFVDRARVVQPDYRLGAAAEPLVADIVRELDGLPLAIELAAARMGVFGERTILARLPRRFELLAGGPRDASARQSTMRGAIEWSWQLLEPWEQAALVQCAVFRGGFTLEAAERVIDLAAFVDAPSPLDVLQALHDKSLVRSDEIARTPGEKRFTLYASIAAFAAEKLEGTGAAAAALDRHAAYYLQVAGAWAEGALHRSDIDCIRRLELELPNLLAVHERALSSAEAPRHGDAVRVALALDAVLPNFGRSDHHAALLDATLATWPARDEGDAGRPTASQRGHVLVARSRARTARGLLAGARSDAAEAIDIARSEHDPFLEGRALNALGAVDEQEGRLDDCEDRYLAARDCFKKSGHARWETAVVFNLGTRRLGTGQLEEARRMFEEARAGFQAVGDRGGAAIADLGRVQVLFEMGRLDEARDEIDRVLPALRELAGSSRAGSALGLSAMIRHAQGRFDEANERYTEAIAVLRDAASRTVEGQVQAAWGALLADMDLIDDATFAFERSREILEAVGAPARLAALRTHLGHLDLMRARASSGDEGSAARHRQAAQARFDQARTGGPTSDDLRFAVRLLQGALGARPDGAGRGSARRQVLSVGREARWFRPPGGERVDVGRGRQIRGLLQVLVDRRLEKPGEAMPVEALLRAAWPGERFAVQRSGAMRVYMLLSRLRSLGLRDVVRSEAGGYLLDPEVEVVVEG